MNAFRLSAVFATSLSVCALAVPSLVWADTDACTLLGPSQVSTAVGVSVGAGEHVTPTFVKTCTWTPAGASAVSAVTLNLQKASSWDGGKQLALQMGALGKAGAKSAGIGEDSYYFVTGEQVGLMVKKGSISFKVAVYAKLPVDQKEAMELALAKEVLKKL